MRRAIRRVGLGLAAIVLSLALLAFATARSGDAVLWPPEAGASLQAIFVVSHGYHAGIALPSAVLADVASRHGHGALVAVTQHFAGHPFIEVGWGDEGFYTTVPDSALLSATTALRALLRPGNPTVMHVVGLADTPRRVFATADIVRIDVSEDGFARLTDALEKSFTRVDGQPQALGRGLYGLSQFYRANGSFHLFNVCNHWVADLLSVAGLPVTPVLATVAPGLLLDLKWRAGLDRIPAEGARP